MDLQWIYVFNGIKMESFARWICNGIIGTKESKWNPLRNGFAMGSFEQRNQNRILHIRFVVVLVYKGTPMKFCVQWICNGFVCTKESQWNLLCKVTLEVAVQQFYNGFLIAN